MNLYRINESGDRVPYNVVSPQFQRARRLTPTPDPQPQAPAPRRSDRSADMLALTFLTLFAALWFVAGYMVGR